MNHDHCHCSGEGCKLRDTCLRYLLTLEEVDFPIYITDPSYEDGKGCGDYYQANESEIKEAKKYGTNNI